jgi:hypothetical protein
VATCTKTRVEGSEQQDPVVVRTNVVSGIRKAPYDDSIDSVQAFLFTVGRSTWLTAFVKRSTHLVQSESPRTFTHPK